MDSSLGDKIRKMRKECRMTQEEFGMEVGVTKGTLCSWEKGLRSPSINAYYKVAQVYQKVTGRDATDVLPNKDESSEDDNQMESTDLTSYAFKYILLDAFGKETVETLIKSEYARCRASDTLEDITGYDISVSAIVDKQLIQNDESDNYLEYIKKFVKLDTWGRKIVEQTIQICRTRCEQEKFIPQYNKFVVDVSLCK